ncbi:MAG TPA: glycosyltransferase family 4 protein [Candidatus Gastranaerophilales bacterium]|nr:glycosyltransferase family 4 protein [Candidatus Gastranaerophilales bacterium]
MTNRKKVLFLTNILSPYMHEFFDHLTKYDEIDFKVAACIKNEPDRAWNTDYLNDAKYNYEIMRDTILVKIPFQNRFFYLGGLSLLRDIIFGGYSAVIFKGGTRFIGPFYAIISRLLGKRTILWEEDNLSGTNLLKKLIKPFYINKLVFSEFIALGAKVKDFLETMISNENNEIYYTYYTINNDKFRQRYLQIKNKKNLAKKALGIDAKKKIILCIARFINDKNLFTFIDAIGELKKQDNNFTCLLIGNGHLDSKIRKYIAYKGLRDVLTLVPFKQFKKLTYYYLISDVFALPSKIEPWGLVVNEAMIFDLPVIVSDKVGCGDDLVQDGYNGYVFPYKDHVALASKIKQVLSNPEKLGQNSYNIIKDKNFDHVSKTIIAASKGLDNSFELTAKQSV